MIQRRAHVLSRTQIDEVWQRAAAELGFTVQRTGDAYASTDGRGTILIGTDETLDDDDCLAQLIFHEICHALVQGEQNWRTPDWGMDNTTDLDDVAEMACLRLQACLSGRHGLRVEMTPTTPWKTYYSTLPADALVTEYSEGPQQDVACALAKTALGLAEQERIRYALDKALATTRVLIDTVADRHSSGFLLGDPNKTCGTCAWYYVGGRGRPVSRCRQSGLDRVDGRPVSATMASCERWEAELDCQDCGACCREAYHLVSVSMRDPAVWKQPSMVVRDGHRFRLAREGDRCAALEVTVAGDSKRYGCRIYEDRPQTCREHERQGVHCLTARRRVGLSK